MSNSGVLYEINIYDDYAAEQGVKLPSTSKVTPAANRIVVKNLTIKFSKVINVDGTETQISGGNNLEFTAANGDAKWRLSSNNTYNPESGVASVPPPSW
ncbi:hypothetical protein [Pseudomonas sp. BE134]|jgi:hypothetical protein|uniref:hypothetical protein n=1 Tax=Pseudomonas sp. BE134 TaxID=2817843 RepID=UPI002857C9DB|nr:hypothetical protein [Pseudomonas sp. BE134]MDR6925010.1 hypothetical protein [Pseudomonas sp. BE134]